ncbi:MAG: 23S rRNA (adenine(2030)-N(6))-methyltransferase RlmJ [Rhodospirillales bacterium]
MLSYQHIYHAGCLADVHKHAALAVLLARLTEKPKPLTYMETHAGRGAYDLMAPEALKTGEAKAGILRLLTSGSVPAAHPYLRAIHATRTRLGDDWYPGSPVIARSLLRHDDALHLMELHPQEHAALKRMMARDGAQIHKRDGYEGVLAISPPAARRGLVLIDPSYEIKSEYDQVSDFILALHRKWAEATILLWYPVLGQGFHRPVVRRLEAAGLPDFWYREISFRTDDSETGMRGSGLLMINTPYGVEPALTGAEAILAPALVKDGG